MIYTIKNDYISVSVNSFGGMLHSIQETDGFEYMWEGHEQIWPERDMVIFPYIARLFDGRYECQGRIYEMDIHGFAKDHHFEVESSSKESIWFKLSYSDETLEQYPFFFVFKIGYQLDKNHIRICYEIANEGKETMYFGVGGHPGFRIPMDHGEFEDYYLEFKEEGQPKRIGMSKSLLRTGEDTPFPLEGGRRISLHHDLFDEDAILLKDMCKTVTLASEQSKRSLTLTYPDMNYLGIWHVPNTKAEYVCLEPWTSLPSCDGAINVLEKQQDLIALEPNGVYENTWQISIR
ncbi:MAG: aldose 1-epimerase family protein [Eubacteriales bacterium]